jgi:hypothetical protein
MTQTHDMSTCVLRSMNVRALEVRSTVIQEWGNYVFPSVGDLFSNSIFHCIIHGIALVLHPDFVLWNKKNTMCVLFIPFLCLKRDIMDISSQTSEKDCSWYKSWIWVAIDETYFALFAENHSLLFAVPQMICDISSQWCKCGRWGAVYRQQNIRMMWRFRSEIK